MSFVIPITFTIFVYVGEGAPVPPGASETSSAPTSSVSTSEIPGVVIDLDIIKDIESGGNPKAFNNRSCATGAYQITQICLDDYNTFGPGKKFCHLRLSDMFIESVGREVADWYFNVRIPALLKAFGILDSVEHRLICYNAGINYLAKKKPLKKETVNYIEKYFARKLTKGDKGRYGTR
jgi:hypothetical protein